MEFERAVLFRHSRFFRLLGPGWHWTRDSVVARLDLRRQDVSVDAGPAWTRDGVPVGVLARVVYRIAEPELAVKWVDRPDQHLQIDALATVLRTVSTLGMVELAPAHNRMELDIQDRLDFEASTYGVRIEEVQVFEVRYPRAIRRRMKRNEVPGLA